MAEDNAANIAAAASEPKRVQGDSGSVEMHSIPDQIAADKYKRETAAVGSRKLPVRYTQARHGGPV